MLQTNHFYLQSFIIAVFALFSFQTVNAQEGSCSTETTESAIQAVQSNVNYVVNIPTQNVQIPIKAWLVGRSNGTGRIPMSDVNAAIREANRNYAPTRLEFFLCETENINSNYFYDFEKSKENSIRQQYFKEDVINIYFVDLQSFCGYAHFPSDGIDVIVMDNGCTTNGSTFSHELGHYFGLFHTHETFKGRELVNGNNCSTSGDLICDTPADPRLSGNVNSSCHYTGTSRDANNHRYNPNPRNIMSYSRKNCRNLFTDGQINRIVSTYFLERFYLTCGSGSGKCDAEEISCGQTIFSTTRNEGNDFDISDFRGCHNSSSSFDAADKLYKVEVNNRSTLKVNLSGLSDDLDIFVLTDCDYVTCVGKSTKPNYSSEEVIIPNAKGTYYIVVDGYNTNQEGSFRLQVSCQDNSGGNCLVSDNFEGYNRGANISSYNPNIWKKWSSSAIDGKISTDKSNSGYQSMEINRNQFGRQDVVLKLGNQTRGIYKVAWKMFINDRDEAYFNIQNSEYNLKSGGAFQITIENTDYDLQEKWFDVELYVDLDRNQMRLFLDNRRYRFDRNFYGNLGGINYYAVSDAHFYIDDVCMEKVYSMPFNDGGDNTASSRNNTNTEIGNLTAGKEADEKAFKANNLDVFPNPTSGQVTVQMDLETEETVDLMIFNTTGQMMKQIPLGKTNRIDQSLNLGEFSNGIYFFKIVGTTTNLTQRVIVQ